LENQKTLPQRIWCIGRACPQIYEGMHKGNESYLIVGEQVNPSDVGLEGKIGEGEILIRVPKNLIDSKKA